jgi:hypothetical protein
LYAKTTMVYRYSADLIKSVAKKYNTNALNEMDNAMTKVKQLSSASIK